jgi:hypothetical protein
VTTSTLTFSPQVDDSGKSLTCRAENKQISGSAQEDTWTLNVHCKYQQRIHSFQISIMIYFVPLFQRPTKRNAVHSFVMKLILCLYN